MRHGASRRLPYRLLDLELEIGCRLLTLALDLPLQFLEGIRIWNRLVVGGDQRQENQLARRIARGSRAVGGLGHRNQRTRDERPVSSTEDLHPFLHGFTSRSRKRTAAVRAGAPSF